MEKQTTDTNKSISPKPIQAGAEHANKQDKQASSTNSIDRKNVDGMDSDASSNQDSPSADQWKTKVDSACKQWNKLQQSELVETGGDNQRISELVQKRYSLNKMEADKQVKEFFSKH